jgi:hypothetical protein
VKRKRCVDGKGGIVFRVLVPKREGTTTGRSRLTRKFVHRTPLRLYYIIISSRSRAGLYIHYRCALIAPQHGKADFNSSDASTRPVNPLSSDQREAWRVHFNPTSIENTFFHQNLVSWAFIQTRELIFANDFGTTAETLSYHSVYFVSDHFHITFSTF